MLDQKVIDAVKKMRTDWKKLDDKRDEGLAHSIPEVQRIDNLQYGDDPRWNSLDLYLPKNFTGKIPVIINIHGGGWIYATKETYQFYGLALAKEGFAFVNFNYMLAPKVQFPGILDQVNQVIHWVADHANQYNLDTNNAFLIGDSAGGQMVEQYTTVLTNPTYRQKFGYSLTNLHFRAVAMNCPATFMLDPGMVITPTRAYFTDEVLNDPKKRDQLNVEKYITNQFLPAYLMTCNLDFVHDCSVRLDGFLRAKGVEVIQKTWGDEKHPEHHVFHVNQKDPLARKANAEEINFFKKHIVNSNSEED